MEQKKYYSYKTFYPDDISGTYVTVYHEVFQNLENKSEEELEELGFKQITLPEGLYKIKNWEEKYPPEEYWNYEYTWNRDIVDFIVKERSLEEKRSMINYAEFWNNFSNSNAYDKVKQKSMTSLSINTVATELLFQFSTLGKLPMNTDKIQNCFNFIFENVDFVELELQEIQEIFVGTGMHYQYTLGNAN